MSNLELTHLLERLLQQGKESECLEFKHNNMAPETVGERISALANGANLHHEAFAYLVFGVEDESLQVLGTAFSLKKARKGNEELEAWLLKMLSPRIDFRCHEFDYQGKSVVLLQIPAAKSQPVRFMNVAYIRVGSTTRKLQDYPEKEAKIWRNESQSNFENEVAKANASGAEVVELLDTQTFFELLRLPYPSNREGVLDKLRAEKMLTRTNGHFNITNLGALLFAKNLDQFEHLAFKTIRVVKYVGKNKLKVEKDLLGQKGYAAGFAGLMNYLKGLLPADEEIGTAFRVEKNAFPPLAIRELVANALVHQDFRVSGLSPMIEVFDDRIEISNPGKPLLLSERFIDGRQSRNELLVSFMYRAGICEGRGSGIDKVIHEIERSQLPAPKFLQNEQQTTAVLFSYRDLSELSREDKIRACYQHCCLRYVSQESMTNQSLRERFKILDSDISKVSRIIKDAMDEGLVKVSDPANKSKKMIRYVPVWA